MLHSQIRRSNGPSTNQVGGSIPVSPIRYAKVGQVLDPKLPLTVVPELYD